MLAISIRIRFPMLTRLLSEVVGGTRASEETSFVQNTLLDDGGADGTYHCRKGFLPVAFSTRVDNQPASEYKNITVHSYTTPIRG